MKAVKVRNLEIGSGMPKICVPIVGKTREEILEAAREIKEAPVDLIEWRADWFEDVFDIEHVKSILAELRSVIGEIPLLFTFRTKTEGGEKEIAYEQYKRLLKCVAEMGLVDLIDVEVFMDNGVSALITEIQEAGVSVVGSNHDFNKTPAKEEIIRRLCHMQVVGVDIPKLAVMPQTEADVLTLLGATKEMTVKYADRPIITMSMAGMGVVSRIAGEIFGSAVTFGAMHKASAPGQLEVQKLREILEILHQAQ